MAAAQLAGEDFQVAAEPAVRRCCRAGARAGAGVGREYACGLALRLSDGRVGGGGDRDRGDPRRDVRGAAPGAAAALCMQVTVDLDTTDVEVYGRGKRGLAYNHQDQRVGRPHPHLADWAETRRCWPRTCARCGGPRRLGR
jgi:hypothetical protein